MVRKVLFMAVATLAIAVPAATGANGKPKPVDAAQAQTLVADPGYSLGTTVTPVSKSDALAAMTQPGATTALAPGFATAQAAVAAATGCAAWQSGVHWGTWPYDQTVWDHTYYCAVYGDHITSRSTTVTVDGTLCGNESRENWIVSGGIGYSWMTVHAQARFSCPTVVPWVNLHPTDWLETAYNAWGNAALVGHS
jgi:hypothetical protein